jgi:hypothetical protein
VTAVLKEGIERTIAQARHACAQIEVDEMGEYWFVKKKDSTVPFVVRTHTSPSLGEFKASHYATWKLGELSNWCCMPLWGLRPEAKLDARPRMRGFQANYIPGGLVLTIHCHHYSNDVMGWHYFVRQLADNCAAVVAASEDNKTRFPVWDPACIDVSCFNKDMPELEGVNIPPQAGRHPDHVEQQLILFHLLDTKARELKAKTQPLADDAAAVPCTSTYDAAMALLWRAMTRQRVPFFNLEASAPASWREAVNMRTRIKSSRVLGRPVPERMQRNMTAAADTLAMKIGPTLAQVVASEAEYPLSRLAALVRRLTNAADEDFLLAKVEKVAPVRDKTRLGLSMEAAPPGSILLRTTALLMWLVSTLASRGPSPIVIRSRLCPLASSSCPLVHPTRAAW